MTGLTMDIRTTLRVMARRPLFTLVCVVTLALGFGSLTAVFTVVDSVLLRSLPYPESDQLVRIHASEDQDEGSSNNVSGADFLDWKAQTTSFDYMAGFVSKSFNLTGTEFPIRVRGASVTPEFFLVLGIESALGRILSPEIDQPDSESAMVVSEGFWRSHLGANPDVIGSNLQVNGLPYTVVGVMPAGFAYPTNTGFWVSSAFRVPDPPVDVGDDPAENRGAEYFHVIGRLKDEVDLSDAQSEMAAIADRLALEYPDTNSGKGIGILPLLDSVIGDAQPRLLLLLASAGLVLLIACVNVAGLLLARATERESEIGLRLAIGAERRRIVRLFLTESLVLAFAGGIVGVGLATWGTKILLAMAPDEFPRTGEVVVDLKVIVFASLAAFVASVLFGLVPAALALRVNSRPTINSGRGGPAFNEGHRLRKWLVVAEVAATLVLVIGTGLVIRTFVNLNAVDPGFNPNGVLVAHLALPSSAYQENHNIVEFNNRVLEKLYTVPGVESASTVLTLPMHWNIRGFLSFVVDGRPESENNPTAAGYQVVGANYFRTMRIPLLRGRLFDDGDVEGAPQVALVNNATAELFWPEEDPIGKRLSWGSSDGDIRDWVTIVGVVEDVYVEGLDTPPRPETYRPFAQDPFPFITYALRTRGDPASYALALRQAVAEVDPDQPVSGIKTMDEVLLTTLSHRRFNMLLMGVFAGVAVLLAAVGLYGMLSFNISRRRHEISIRRALGALPRDITAQFISEGFRMVVVGLCIGTAGALALTRFISTQLHGVSATDLPTYTIATLVLLSVGLLASFLSARRAALVEPMTVLRSE